MRGGPKRLKQPVERAVLLRFVERIRDDIRIPRDGFKFMTQTLNPSIYKYPAHKQFIMVYHDFISILEYCFEDYCYVAEVTDKGNVHFHFWYILKPDQIIACYYDLVKTCKYLGGNYETKIKSNKSEEEQMSSTYDYMTKEVEKSYRFIRNIYLSGNKRQSLDTISPKEWVERHLQYLDNMEV